MKKSWRIVIFVVTLFFILGVVCMRTSVFQFEMFRQEFTDPRWVIPTNDFRIHSAPSSLRVDTAQRIPRILHQTARSADLDIQVYETCMINRGMNPEYEYRFYSDVDVQGFIQTHFPHYLDLYETVIPGAFRADLFRYMVLYVHGGVYLDCKSSTILPFRDFLPADVTFASFLDRLPTSLQISFLAATPQHPVIGACITQAFENIANREYGECTFDITGPTLCGKMFNRVLGREELAPIEIATYGGEYAILGAMKTVKPSQNYEVLVNASDEPLISRACGSYYRGSLWNNPFDSYGTRWMMGRVYKASSKHSKALTHDR